MRKRFDDEDERPGGFWRFVRGVLFALVVSVGVVAALSLFVLPPPAPPPPPPVVPLELTPDDEFASRSLEEVNRESPLDPAFFALDSSELDDRGRQALEANAEVLRQYPSWVVTIEGHCDERGTAEYNLGLGERRALAAQRYLVELGIDSERVRTVSYGKEFPFDPAHDDNAWAANRRAHFVITAK